LLNLALNARDAMPEGGELTITVSERDLDTYVARLVEVPAGKYVQIDVSDSGTGIEPELLQRVFEPFFTTKPFGSGSGLGLSMVYGFVRQSGGNIRVVSTPGKGTSVRFVLPRSYAPDLAAAQAERVTAPTHISQGPVLLVEDEPDVRKIIRLQLTALGHVVIEAENGVEALPLLENIDDISLLVSDTIMPGGVGGRELAARARTLRPKLPILLITGYASTEEDEQSLSADIPVLRKPFDQAVLAAALNELDPPEETC